MGLALNFAPAPRYNVLETIMHKQQHCHKFALDVKVNTYKKRVFQIRNSTSGSQLLHRRQKEIDQKRLTGYEGMGKLVNFRSFLGLKSTI